MRKHPKRRQLQGRARETDRQVVAIPDISELGLMTRGCRRLYCIPVLIHANSGGPKIRLQGEKGKGKWFTQRLFL